MNPSNPMQKEADLAGLSIDISHNLFDDRSDDPLLQPGVCRWPSPDRRQIRREVGKRHGRHIRLTSRMKIVRGNAAFHVIHACQRPVPTLLQFRGDQSVPGIDGIVLTESPIGGVTCSLQVPVERSPHVVSTRFFLRISCGRRSDRTRLNNLEDRAFDRVIDPQSAKSDAARLTIVQPATCAAVSWNSDAWSLCSAP